MAAWKRAAAKIKAGMKMGTLHKDVVSARAAKEEWKKSWEQVCLRGMSGECVARWF